MRRSASPGFSLAFQIGAFPGYGIQGVHRIVMVALPEDPVKRNDSTENKTMEMKTAVAMTWALRAMTEDTVLAFL